jgi:SM-20-related protein
MNVISVYDKVLSESQAETLYTHFANCKEWSFGHKSINNTMTASIPHWSIYYHMEDLEEGTPRDQVNFTNTNIQALFESLYENGIIPQSARLLRCYANGHTYGIDGNIHYDDKRPNTITVIYYPMRHWSVDWGGETIFWDREKREIIKSVIPKNNRLVVFPAAHWHGVRPMSRYAETTLRVTLMFKFIIPI